MAFIGKGEKIETEVVVGLQKVIQVFFDKPKIPYLGYLFYIEAVNALDPYGYQPFGNVTYPDDEFGLGLRQVAMLIKADVGLEVACLMWAAGIPTLPRAAAKG